MSDRPWQLFPGWMTKIETKEWKEKISTNLEWQQPNVKVFGKKYLIPRKTIFIGEKNISYSYSGITHQSIGWPNWFYPLLERVCLTSETTFNGCLLNLYRNGNDRMGWHADNEKELKYDKPIASLTLGAERDFSLKNCFLPIKENLLLQDGDLLIMKPPCQTEWLHSVPIRKRVLDSRINLTFRCYR